MFGFFKKKNKAVNKTEPVAETNAIKYTPRLGNPNDFIQLYRTGEEHIVLGRHEGSNVGVTAIDPPGDSLYVINDDADSILRHCVIPTVEQGKLSYIVYDPDGQYQNALADKMKARLYDIQVIDFEDETNKSRVDLFEVVNITKNTYWTAVLLAGAIKCVGREINAAHNLFMTMMEYLLASKGYINITDMCQLFNKVSINDKETLLDMEKCSSARPALLRLINASPEDRATVYKKANATFFKFAEAKLANPNIFMVTSHKRQTVTFVRRVPSQYRSFMTALLFNLKVASVVCGDGSTSTLIVDTHRDDWYDRALLERLTQEAGEVMDKSVAVMKIRATADDLLLAKSQILIYMHSSDLETRQLIYSFLKVKSLLTNEEQLQVAATHYHNKPLSKEALEVGAIPFEELETLKDQIIVDIPNQAKAFRCNRLA